MGVSNAFRTKCLRRCARDRGHVCRHVGDLLLGELVGERRHRTLPVRDTIHDERDGRPRRVEIRADGARCRRVGKRVARDVARGTPLSWDLIGGESVR